MMQFTERNFDLEKMRPPKGKWSSEKWNPKGNLSYFSKKRNMEYVLENYLKFDFENFSNDNCSAVRKSWETILVLKRLGRLKNVLALYWITRNPPEPEESGFEKKLRLRSPKTEEFKGISKIPLKMY